MFEDLVEEKVDDRLERQAVENKAAREKKSSMKQKEQSNNTSKERPESGKLIAVMKSLSESTLFVPAFTKMSKESKVNQIIEKISDFVESIRMDSNHSTLQRLGTPRSQREKSKEEEDWRGTPIQGTSKDQSKSTSRKHIAGKKADKLVINAEKIKANLLAPQGMLPINIDQNIELLRNLDSDDDFFHVSCHIDQSLKLKMQRGEFVYLERLLPKDRSIARHSMEEGTVVQLYTRNGQAYFAPPDSEKQINGIKRWDQVFRVYATIFTQANPQRASEIWQYVHVIHTAVASYNWNNVAYYEFTFVN